MQGTKEKKEALARESRRIAVRRKHAVHRLTTDIIQRHSANLVVEALKITNMTAKGGSRKRGLNRAMLSQSLSMVVNHLVYKAESAGGKVVFVDPRNTTQQCSACGGMPPDRLTLSDRVYACVHCGHVQDRDVNAARNIRMKGLAHFTRPGLSARRQAEEGYPRPLAARSNGAAKPGHDAETYGKVVHLAVQAPINLQQASRPLRG